MRGKAVALAAVLAVASCAAPSPTSSDLATDAATVVRALGLTAASQVYAVRDPYPSGRTLQIRPEVGEATTFATTSTTRLFMIDDAPGDRFGHPVRYAFLGSDGQVQTTDALWLATVDDVERWQLDSTLESSGVLFGVLAPVTGSARLETPSTWSALVAAIVGDGRATAAQSAAGRKVAVVVDGGDNLITVPPSLAQDERAKRLARIRLREKMGDESDNVKIQLGGAGYEVERFSGSVGNPNVAATTQALRDAILKAKDLRPGDEFVLYLNGHGVPLLGPDKKTAIDGVGVTLCAKTGSCQLLPYGTLATWLGELDPGVKKIVAIDACYSGGAVEVLRRISGVQVFTASSKNKTANGGLGEKESFSDSFLKTPETGTLEDRLIAASRARQDTGATVSLGEGLFGAALPTLTPTPTPDPTVSAATQTAPPTQPPTQKPTTPPTQPPTTPPTQPPTAAPKTAAPTAVPVSTSTVSPARDLTGTWRGGIASTGYFDGEAFCKWTGSITLELKQTDNTLAGTADLAWQTGTALKPYASCELTPERYGITGTASASAITFQFTGGDAGWFGTGRGSFTSDLLRANFSGSGSDYGAGCIQVSRTGVGALPSC